MAEVDPLRREWRWLTEQGIINLVVDSANIEVNQRRRRAKTDRLDSDKLLSMLIRFYAGERRLWSVARIPTPEQEDDRRMHRELERLRHERTAHTNRIRALLVLHNLRVKYVGGRTWTHWWAQQRERLLLAEIEREFDRLVPVGTMVTHRPPDRSVRAELLHTALTKGVDAKPLSRMRMDESTRRQVFAKQPCEARLGHASALTST